MEELDLARDALARGEFASALELLENADASCDCAEMLELRAQAAYGAGEFEEAVQAWEDLHQHHLEQNDPEGAATAAAMIAMYLMMDTGLMAPVRGWLRTAERLLEGFDETPAHALIAMTRTYERFMSGDMDEARNQSVLAIDLGTRHDVNPAVVIGQVAAARVRIFDGDLQGGLDQLEEVGAMLMSGGADPLTTGMMYCEIICAAQGLALHDMAAQWTQVMETWRHGAAVGGINGRCRVHRAEILRMTGPCDKAEAEALGACDELRPWMRREFGWPLVELGNVRLRRGDLAGAESAFLEAYEHAWSPQPGLALVHLARGDPETAASMITDAIEHPLDIPSKEHPPFGDLRLAPLLGAQAEIAAVLRDIETTRAAADRLTRIAEHFPGPFLRASASLARGRAALVEGDPDEAVRLCLGAVLAWVDIGAPFEAANARVALGQAHASAGRDDAARREFAAAEAAFRRFGADRCAVEAARLAKRSFSPHTEPETQVASGGERGLLARFTAEGTNRNVEFLGRSTVIRDLKGLRYIARMVAEPGREFHVLDLVAAGDGVIRPHGATGADAELSVKAGDTGIPILDDTAREAYRRRLADIDEDIEEATRLNDPGRVELAQRDRDYLVAELASAIGLGGRDRTVGGTSERARTSVARSVRYALQQLKSAQPDLAKHLQSAISTGTYCSYQPDPLTPITWHT